MIPPRVAALITQTAQMRQLLKQLLPRSRLFPAPYVTIIHQIETLIKESDITKAALLSVLDLSGQASILHIAVLYHDVALVKRLLASGVKLSVRNSKGETPLHWAVREQAEAVLALLLTLRVPLDLQDSVGRTALHWATWAWRPRLVALLVLAGASLEIKDHKDHTPVYYIQKNIELSPALFVIDPIHMRGQVCRKKLALFLLDTYQVLFHAIKNNDVNQVQWLLRMGHAVNKQDAVGNTTLMLAADLQFLDLVALLLEYGASANIQNKFGNTALQLFETHQFLHSAVKKGDLVFVQLLLAAGMRVNTQDLAGDTPLHLAAEQQSLELSALLLDYGADLEIANNAGESPREVLERLKLCSPLAQLGLEQLDDCGLSQAPDWVHFSATPNPAPTPVRLTRSEFLELEPTPATGDVKRAMTYNDLTTFGLD